MPGAMLSPVDGRQIPERWQADLETFLRQAYRGRDDPIPRAVWTMHRMSVGSIAYVGTTDYPRIPVLRSFFLCHPDIQRRESTAGLQSILEAHAVISQAAKEAEQRKIQGILLW